MGTLNAFRYLARVLINPGVTHSVISLMLAQKVNPQPTTLGFEFPFKGCPVFIDDEMVEAVFIHLIILDIDLSLEMGWLSKNYSLVDCYTKEVTLRTLGRSYIIF